MQKNPTGLDQSIKDLKAKLKEALERGRSLQSRAFDEVNNKLRTLETQSFKIMEVFKANPAFATDLKIIENTQAMINDLLNNREGEGTAERIETLQAVDRLVEQLKQQIKQAGDANGATTLPQNMLSFEKSLDKAADFKKYNEDGLNELKQKFANFKKLQQNMPASDAVKAYAELSASFRDKDKEAKEIAQLIKDQANNYQQWLASVAYVANENGMKREEQCFDAVLAAYEEAINARPAVKSAIETAFQQMQAAFTHPPTPPGNQSVSLSSEEIRSKMEQEQGVIRQRLKQTREEASQRLKVLKERLNVAKKLVDEKGGDTSPAKAVERLLNDAEEAIKSKTPESASDVLNRAEQRIYVILANPAGGLARKRSEIPALLKEWETAREATSNALKQLAETVLGYQPSDQEKWSAVADLGGLILEYERDFAGDADPLKKPLEILADKEAAEGVRRKAREDAVAAIGDLTRRLQSHPMSRQLAAAPFPEARSVPQRLIQKLDTMNYIVMTSVE